MHTIYKFTVITGGVHNEQDRISCSNCKVLGFVVPGDKKLFKSKEDLFIPWKNIQKIGDDVILVQLFEGSYATPPGGYLEGDVQVCDE